MDSIGTLISNLYYHPPMNRRSRIHVDGPKDWDSDNQRNDDNQKRQNYFLSRISRTPHLKAILVNRNSLTYNPRRRFEPSCETLQELVF